MKKLVTLSTLYGSLLFALPAIVSAQALQPVANVVNAAGGIINLLIPILIALALVVFFYGLVRYIWGSASAESKTSGRNIMIAGIVSLFVMVSIWGIINIIQGSLGVNPTGAVQVPTVPLQNQY